MEVISASPHGTPSLSSYFDVSPNGFAFRAPCSERIMDRRVELDDKLIFDILLASGGIRDPEFLYPPRDPEGLERLLDAIQNSTYDILKKHTLIYFLLKWHMDGRENTFKNTFSIPPHFSALADAYWGLDSGTEVAKAVSILSDSRLNRDHTSKIIHAISLAPEPGPLILKYVRTTKPPLVEPPDMLRYLLALVESSVLEAWQYQRSFSESDEMRPRLFKSIIDWAIIPTAKPAALKDLISLPLSQFEQNLLNEYALQPPSTWKSSSVAILQDLVCVRYIELGKYIEAIKLDRKFSATGYDNRESNDRRSMIRELYDSLPPVEKSLIESDFAPRRDGAKAQLTTSISVGPSAVAATANDVSISQSWEEVPVPENFNKSISTPLRKIQIPSAVGTITQPQFTVPTTTGTEPSVSAAQASLSASPPPLLPFSNGAAPAPPSLSAYTPRKSQPLSSLGKGRPGLSGVGQKIMALNGSPSISSPVSGMRFPVGSNKPASSSATAAAQAQPTFVSTVNRENAFYHPKQTAQKRPAPEDDDLSGKDASVADDMNAPPGVSLRDEDMEVEVDGEGEEKSPPAWRDDDTGVELSESIFGKGARLESSPAPKSARSRPQRAAPAPPVVRTSSSNGGRQKRQKQEKAKPLPGAFGDDDNEGDNEEEPEEQEAELAPSSRSKRSSVTRATRASKEPSVAPSTAPQAATSRKTRQIKQKDFGRSIPGSLMDDDEPEDEEDAEEEQDTLGPLPGSTPPPVPIPTSKRPVRKSRSVMSAGSEGGSDGEGPSTRRRSSRLSTSGSVKEVSVEPEVKVGSSGRKTGKTAGSSKRKK